MKENENRKQIIQEDSQEQFTKWAMKILAISKAALTYSDSPFEIERAFELEKIGLEMLMWQTECPIESLHRMICEEEGYTTPKIDTRAAAFDGDRILLVKEKNGKWSLPGGWCEVDLSIKENTIKEMEEEAGYSGKAKKLIAVQDWRKHNPCNLPYGVVKVFVEVEIDQKMELDGIETTEAGFFSRDELPGSEELNNEKDTREQILLCFQAHDSQENWVTEFD